MFSHLKRNIKIYFVVAGSRIRQISSCTMSRDRRYERLFIDVKIEKTLMALANFTPFFRHCPRGGTYFCHI